MTETRTSVVFDIESLSAMPPVTSVATPSRSAASESRETSLDLSDSSRERAVMSSGWTGCSSRSD